MQRHALRGRVQGCLGPPLQLRPCSHPVQQQALPGASKLRPQLQAPQLLPTTKSSLIWQLPYSEMQSAWTPTAWSQRMETCRWVLTACAQCPTCLHSMSLDGTRVRVQQPAGQPATRHAMPAV